MNADFALNGLVVNGDSNVRYSFAKMTKRFGKHYLDYLAAAYQAKDEMTDEEFCRLNGEVPLSFIPTIANRDI